MFMRMPCAASIAALIATTGVGCGAHCAKSSTGTAQPAQGIIWVDHFSIREGVSDSGQLITQTNGIDVFFKARTDVPVVFPAGALPLLGVPIQSHPGLPVTGVIACVAIQGDNSATKINRLRLAQFDKAVQAYTVKLEADVQTQSPPVGPPDSAGSFACVDTGSKVCLDPLAGTIDVSLGVQVGDSDDAIRLRALGVRYDATCAPKP